MQLNWSPPKIASLRRDGVYRDLSISFRKRSAQKVWTRIYTVTIFVETRHLMCASRHSMCAREIIPFSHHCNFYVCLLRSCRTKIRKQKSNITTINQPTDTKRKKACVPMDLDRTSQTHNMTVMLGHYWTQTCPCLVTRSSANKTLT